MSVLVGLPRDGRATAVLLLGAQVARSLGDTLVVATVVPAPWPPSMARVDAEYQEHLDRAAREALDRARDLLPDDVAAGFVVERARSAPSGLLDLAERHDATLLVLGSSAAGALGRVTLGSVAERLLHSAPLPVLLAPRGFRCRPAARVTRVTAAFGAADGSDELVVAVAGVAARFGVPLRVASFAVRPRTPLTAGIGSRAEAAVVTGWTAGVREAQRTVLAAVAALPRVPPAVDAVVGHGEDWPAALEDVEWSDGDVLAVGSSSIGPIARVFLGSRASKIVRSAPVPVVVIPRGVVDALADRAEHDTP